MTWVVLGIVAILVGLWLPTFTRRLKLEEAIRFGREFYGIDLTEIVGTGSQRQWVLSQVKTRDERTPQSIFFMIVASVLGVLDGLKRLELYDGFLQMQLAGAVSQQTVEEFMNEYLACSEPEYDWAESALSPKD